MIELVGENDCPICFEPMINNNNESCSMNGNNCEHQVCIPCYCKISISQNNKCPICRAVLEGKSEECNDLFDGNNVRPINELFIGRRGFNVESKKIEYFFIY